MIEVKNLFKSYDNFSAINNLSLSVDKGSIYGLVGVNGSGKTTLIRLLTGILKADEGSIQIDGQNVYDNAAVKAKIGYIPDDLYFFGNYSLQAMASLYYGIYKTWNNQRYSEMVKAFNLPTNKPIVRFSKGMQKQAAFVLILSTCPEYLILDEPVDGLDPIVRRKIWKYVLGDVAERQMTVLISSHNLRELEGLVDHVGIMNKGTVVLERGNLDELSSENGLPGLEELFFKEVEGEENV